MIVARMTFIGYNLGMENPEDSSVRWEKRRKYLVQHLMLSMLKMTVRAQEPLELGITPTQRIYAGKLMASSRRIAGLSADAAWTTALDQVGIDSETKMRIWDAKEKIYQNPSDD